MVIHTKTENPAVDVRREHAATLHAQLEELQQTSKQYVFVAMYEIFLLFPSFMMSGFGV